MGSIQKFRKRNPNIFQKWSILLAGAIIIILLLFLGIGLLTGAKTTYKLYSSTIQNFTTQIDGEAFIHLFEMENRKFADAHPEGSKLPSISTLSFQLLTNVKPHDLRSLLGREIPGLSSYNSEIVIAGEGTDYTTLPVESEAPVDVVQKDREAKDAEQDEQESEEEKEPQEGMTDPKVFIYHTHNRESFLPHLPDNTPAAEAFHGEVNITLVGKRLAETLERNGIGSSVDFTDMSAVLKDKNMEYHQSYDAARTVVESAIAETKTFTYFFDLHRDSLPRDVTTVEIDGKNYARTIFVIGAEHSQYEKNLKLATELHERLEKEFPGLSRGVITKKGSGVDGVYNQDLDPNASLIEFGGVENNLDELYRSAEAVGEVFSEYYWQAEEVSENE
ncbi:stage II sporulation protein P [Halobacillus andaensis]|uniref:Stage II sporulation protein P n=1 Tax=Halobacillus andaensis TaxID=1176239 RepID=A0A917AZ48_HALAA|nr:stage II sporulation protein P [Halobacillus andaensis]MBP2003033.1 stage II sporulation protein P [Halobacillus andaensis]GGF07498.1 stage II sporulation protein P [Halobacillus andaensis]